MKGGRRRAAPNGKRDGKVVVVDLCPIRLPRTSAGVSTGRIFCRTQLTFFLFPYFVRLSLLLFFFFLFCPLGESLLFSVLALLLLLLEQQFYRFLLGFMGPPHRLEYLQCTALLFLLFFIPLLRSGEDVHKSGGGVESIRAARRPADGDDRDGKRRRRRPITSGEKRGGGQVHGRERGTTPSNGFPILPVLGSGVAGCFRVYGEGWREQSLQRLGDLRRLRHCHWRREGHTGLAISDTGGGFGRVEGSGEWRWLLLLQLDLLDTILNVRHLTSQLLQIRHQLLKLSGRIGRGGVVVLHRGATTLRRWRQHGSGGRTCEGERHQRDGGTGWT